MWSVLLATLVLTLVSVKFSTGYVQAPAEVTIKIFVTKLSDNFVNNESITLRLCVDKVEEKCYWTFKKEFEFKNDLGTAISYDFQINNMGLDLLIGLKLEQKTIEHNFPREKFNLKTIHKSKTMDIHSFDLESIIRVIISHKCVVGYHPPMQCNNFCYPIAGRHKCDDFGRLICESGLYYDSTTNKCISNTCVKSSIQCQNNGKCVNKESSFICVCNHGYTGSLCEKKSLCSPNPCKNQGNCVLIDDNNYFKCECESGYYGNLCDRKKVEKCNCPKNMKCNYSPTGILQSCTVEGIVPNITEPLKFKNVKYIKEEEPWEQITMTTMIIAAVGCILFIVCIFTTACVLYQTRRYNSLPKVPLSKTCTSPSTQYTPFSPPLTSDSTFKRTFSMDQNSIYVPISANDLCTLTSSGNFHNNDASNLVNCLGNGHCGSSVHSNSYQDNDTTINAHTTTSHQQLLPLSPPMSPQPPSSLLYSHPIARTHLHQQLQLQQTPYCSMSDPSASPLPKEDESNNQSPALPPRPSPEVLLSLKQSNID